MKTIKKLKKEIDKIDEGCKAKKMYTTDGGAVRFYTCGRMKKCHQCEPKLIKLEAKLKQTKEICKMIEDEKHNCKVLGFKAEESVLISIIAKIQGEKDGR